MCISVKQVMQRVMVRQPDGAVVKPGHHIISVLGEIGLAALCDHLHEPTLIGAREIARRIGKESCEAKSVRRAINKCVAYGILRRESPPAEDFRANRPWPVWFHPAIIEASQASKPWNGPDIIFPRAWTDVMVFGTCTHLNPLVESKPTDECYFAANKIHRPAAGVFNSKKMEQPTSAAFYFDGNDLNNVGLPDPSVLNEFDATAFWRWIADGLCNSRWEGWLSLYGQRRKKDGQRGGTFTLAQVMVEKESIADVLGPQLESASLCAIAAATSRSPKRGPLIEVVFKLDTLPHPLLLVDDVTLTTAMEELKALPGVALVETSPGCYQASIMMREPLSAAQLVQAQRGFAQLYGGDAGAVGRQQLRRPPGSMNQKRSLAQPFAAIVRCLNGGQFPADLLDKAMACGQQFERDNSTSVREYGSGARRVGIDDSESAKDFGFVTEQLTTRGTRMTHSQIINQVARRAGERRRHGFKPGDVRHYKYAVRTLLSALRKLGLHADIGGNAP